MTLGAGSEKVVAAGEVRVSDAHQTLRVGPSNLPERGIWVLRGDMQKGDRFPAEW